MSGVLNAVERGSFLISRPFVYVGNKIYSVYDTVLPRNEVTHSREFRLIGLRAEKMLGNVLYSDLIESEGGKISDIQLQSEIKEIGLTLSRYTARQGLDYEFTVIKKNSMNAWALPNGKTAIYEGAINKIDKVYRKIESSTVFDGKWSKYKGVTREDLIAAILSHEIIHSDARHTAARMEKTIIIQFVICLFKFIANLVIESKKTKNAKNQEDRDRNVKLNKMKKVINKINNFLSDIGFKLYKFALSRTCEHQADTYGMELMQKAGYNPMGALALQEIFVEKEGGAPSKLHRYTLGLFRTHPFAVDRLKANEEKMSSLLPQ